MTMEEEFAALRAAEEHQSVMMMARFLEKNDDMVSIIDRKDTRLEYIPERDHLYILFGPPQESMAMLWNDMVINVDPETMELRSIEFPDFQAGIAKGKWPAFEPIAKFMEWQPIMHIPASAHEATSEQPSALAKSIERQLAPV